ncbi:hypothetical protein FJZ19_00875 [Candidatus Pacearchaeota archaeon]|nr:hypothetical protein [Candidatus Pacearchaeota archaeon]
MKLTKRQQELADLIELLRKAEDAVDIKDEEQANLTFSIAYKEFSIQIRGIKTARQKENPSYRWGNRLIECADQIYFEFKEKHAWRRQELVA